MARREPQARKMRDSAYTLDLNEKQVLYYRTHPVQACKDLLGIKLIWLQRITLRMIWFKRFPLLNMGRGVGKSYMVAVAAVLMAMLYPRTKIGVIAPVFRQANYVFDAIDDIYNSSVYLQSATVRSPSRGAAQSILRYHNASFVEALPVGDGNKIRGRRYNVIFIDEYAQMDETIIKLVIRPMLNIKRARRENKLIVASTAYYRWNHYWTLYLYYIRQLQGNHPDYGIAEYDYIDVQNTPDSPYQIDNEIIEMQKNDMTHEEFAMENLCMFPADSVSFISSRLIDQCTPKAPDPIVPELMQPEEQNTAKYVLGIDCARVAGGDNFSMQVLKLDQNKKILVYGASANGITFQEMANMTRNMLLDFNVIRIHMGPGGGGLALKDLLAERWVNRDGELMPSILDMDDPEHQAKDGLHVLRMVNESAKKNNELYMNLKSEMQHKRLLFPIDVRSFSEKESKYIKDVYKEVLATKRELLVLEAIPSGIYHKFTVPNKYRKDRATSLVMAVDAAIEVGRVDKVETTGELPVGFFVD